MGANSNIEWTDATWNPVSGCARVSAGCDHCYAVWMTRRLEGAARGAVGKGRLRAAGLKYVGLTVEQKPAAIAQGIGVDGWHFNGKVRCHADVLGVPLRWKKPRRIFVNSMSDLFHKDVPFEFIDQVFAVMALTPRHTYQILTKRPERMAEYLAEEHRDLIIDAAVWDIKPEFAAKRELGETIVRDYDVVKLPLPNVWLGTSVEDQAALDLRWPWLAKCPAAVRFLSVEPMLGAIDFLRTPRPGHTIDWLTGEQETAREKVNAPRIDWVICGGESGPQARPMHPDWARWIRDQCQDAGVPFFFKQWGEFGPIGGDTRGDRVVLTDGASYTHGQVAEKQIAKEHLGGTGSWKAGLNPTIMHRVGKAAAGRVLDGRTWDEFPEVGR